MISPNKFQQNIGKQLDKLMNFLKNLRQHRITFVSLSIVLLLALVALLLPYLPIEDPREMVGGRQFLEPSVDHIMGTDNYGRDLFSRVLWGTRVAFSVGLISAGIAGGLGVLLGATAAYYGGFADHLLSRLFDLFLIIPRFVLAIMVVALFGSDIRLIMLVIGLTTFPHAARIMRSQVMSIKQRTFVEGIRASGASDLRTLFGHIVPNGIAPLVSYSTILMGRAILAEAGLSFLGLGDPQVISWGQMIMTGRDFIRTTPWMIIFPGLAMLILVCAVNLVGDGLNYVIDPRLRSRTKEGSPLSKQKHKSEEISTESGAGSSALMEIRNLNMHYRIASGESAKAVDDVSLSIHSGETVGLVGESGCGKTSLGLSLLQVLPPNGRIVGGNIFFDGRDLLSLGEQELNKYRWREISMIFQSAMNALHPVTRVDEQLKSLYKWHNPSANPTEIQHAVNEAFDLAMMPHSARDSYPHELSGGMKQRAIIAMALLLKPRVVIADEPTTALDVLVQDRILYELDNLKTKLNLTLILISHDVATVGEMSDKVAVMYGGQMVEVGPTPTVMGNPRHPYTQSLMVGIPDLELPQGVLTPLKGKPPDLTKMQEGCKFRPRCPVATEECAIKNPSLQKDGQHHTFRCLYGKQTGEGKTAPITEDS